MTHNNTHNQTPPPGTAMSRRQAIKATVLAATSLIALHSRIHAYAQDDTPYDPGGRVRVDYDETASFNEMLGYPPLLGRSETWRLKITKEPEDGSEVVRGVKYDEVLPIYEAINATAPKSLAHNDVWYNVGEGFIHSSYIVPVHEVFNEPEDTIGDGFWGEITVPTSWQHWTPKLRSRRYYDLAYGTIYKVIDRADEEDGRAWYRIVDDLVPASEWWIQAAHVRRIVPSEFTPISPDVPPELKRVEVSIGEQLLTCFEDTLPVFSARIASGAAFFDTAGQLHHFRTPYGEHRVIRKTPSRRMVGGEIINDRYDLPGVPWCIFFTGKGAAIHGTYWHNDFGRPRSHGCVNITNDASKWVYRWVNPHASHDDDIRWTDREELETATIINVEP
ncbi:MAG: L,D-transpeptidase [Anaerolineae bacterium]|nr:L,D-transpeptidase [Anaerolineae bacterium]